MPRILVVDDEPAVVDVISNMLIALGYEPQGYSDPCGALLKIETGPVDLVISDLVMPQMDGIELLRRIRRIDPELPFIVVTGNATVESAIEAIRLDADDFLLKPVSLNQLNFRVSQCLGRKRTRQKMQVYESLLPVCSGCHKIRLVEEEGEEAWVSLESYFRRRTGRAVSHGYCPDCFQDFMDIERPVE